MMLQVKHLQSLNRAIWFYDLAIVSFDAYKSDAIVATLQDTDVRGYGHTYIAAFLDLCRSFCDQWQRLIMEQHMPEPHEATRDWMKENVSYVLDLD